MFPYILINCDPMAAELLSAVVNFAITGSVRVPETHTPGDRSARTRNRIGADVSYSELLKYDSDQTAPDVTEPNARAILRQTFAIPVGLTYELDLSAAPIEAAVSAGARALTEDLDGYKLLAFLFSTIRTDGVTNAGNITIKPTAANGYLLWGTAMADGVILTPDSIVAKYHESDDLPDIDNATAYLIDFVGTEDDEVEVVMLFSE